MAGAKQFPASRKKLDKAREQGDVAKSLELSIGFSGLAFALCALFWLPEAASRTLEYMIAAQGVDRDFHSKDMLVSVQEALLVGARLLTAPLAVVWLALVLIETVQVGFKFSWAVLLWKWSRVSFLSGFKRMCGWQEGSESSLPLGLFAALGKSLAVCGGLGAAGGWVMFSIVRSLAGTHCRNEAELWLALLQASTLVTLPMVAITIVIGGFDWMLARVRRGRRLRMDLEELKRELRESEGDPETRSMRKQLHNELLLHGLLEGIRNASVVVLGRREEKR